MRGDGEVIWVHARSSADLNALGESIVVGVAQDITERRQAEAERDLARRRLQSLFDMSTIGMAIITPPAGTPLACNEALAAMLGYTPEAIMAVDFVQHTTATDLDAQQPYFDQIRAGEIDHFEVEKNYIRKDGSLVPIRLWLSAVRDAETGAVENYVALIEDLSESKRTLEELQEKAGALERAHEIGRLGSWYTDHQRGTTTWSAELARLVGLGDEAFETDGQYWQTFVHPDDFDAVLEKWQSLRDARPTTLTLDYRFCAPDGRVISVRSHANAEYDENGNRLRTIGVLQDVTEQRELEQRIRQGQRLEAVGQLAGGVAHDFNNLLTVIGGNAEMALAEVDDTRVKSDLREILRSAERATDLVRQLLAFSRADVVEARSVDLNDAVTAVRRMLARLLRENIELRLELAPEQPKILADPGQLEQVLLNLAVNARDAMPSGGALTIRTRADASTVTLDVSDTGVGMDDHTRERIFNPFFTTKAPGEGTGLGLSTVYGIVTSGGGEIEVDSKLGAGTTFRLTFPRSADQVAEEAPAARGLVRGSGERILLVEDEEMVRAVTAELLSRAGYSVVAANDGEEALRVLDEADRPFDLLFTDLMMPRMTGTELADRLHARGIDLPVVYSSGYAQNVLGDREPDDRSVVLSKPFTGEALSAAVHDLLERARKTARQ